MTVCVIDQVIVSESFYTHITISFENHHTSTRHLGCMNVLVYARECDPACMRYRLGKFF